MPVHLRALVVVLTLMLVVLFVARRVACVHAIQPQDYKRRAALLVFITLAAFLSHSYWLFCLLALPAIAVAGSNDSNRLSFFLFLMFAMPPFRVQIPGMGVIEYLAHVDHLRWLALVVLLPAYMRLRSEPGVAPFGSSVIDKFVIAHVVLGLVLQGMSTSVTNLMRISVYQVLDVVLPYYVASRAVRNMQAFRDTLMSFVVAVLVMAPIAVFETIRYWLLYNAIDQAMGLDSWGWGNYLSRGELALRASVSTGHPIVLGYVMAVALALNAFLRLSVSKQSHWLMVCGALVAGLIAAVSRGPWVGAAAASALLLVTGPRVGSKMMKASMLGVVALPLLLMTSQGQRVIDLLPWVGTVESANVEFRQRLMEVSLKVLANFPWFGALDYLSHPEMELMRGGDGIIDMVNTYLVVGMSSGVVGLSLFVAPFVLSAVGIVRALRSLPQNDERHLLGRTLLAALVAIMVTIGTVSPVCAVPVVYFVVVGLGAGYVHMVASRAPESAPALRPSGARGSLTAPGSRAGVPSLRGSRNH